MKQVYSEIPKGATDQPLFGPSTIDVKRLEGLIGDPRFKHVVNIPIVGLITIPPIWNGGAKLCNNLIVVRDIPIINMIQELKHVLMDTAIQTKSYCGSYLDMPIIDMHAMLEYLCSDLDKILSGSMDVSNMVQRYVVTEILDHDAELTPLLQGVMDIVRSLFKRLCQFLLDHPIDHHAPHQYELQEILPSGGLVLRRRPG